MAEAGSDFSFFDYVREAFFRKVKVPLLGGLPANLMALGIVGVLGIANPGFWLLGLAGELAYLAGVAGSGRFQKLVQGERLLSAQKGWETQLSQAVLRLTNDNQERYKAVLEQCRAILGIADKLDTQNLGGLRDMRSRNLNQLLVIFLRLLASGEVIESNLKNADRRSLEASITQLEGALGQANDNEALKRSLMGTLEIQKKRLDNFTRARASLQVIEAELLRIEEQVKLLREEAAVSGDPASLSSRLDTVTSLMNETTRWMDENAQILGSVGSDATSEVPELPRLPGLVSE